MTLPTPTPLTDAEIADLRAAFADPYNSGLCDDDKMWRGARSDVGRLLATITSLQSDLQRTREALKECADELGEHIEAAYARTKNNYPSETRRYNRDMEMVIRARAILTPPTGT